jgi:Putative prokaryotic signal transducing protein
MKDEPKELLRVSTGSLTQVQYMRELLENAGIESQVVGDNLTAGLGTALPDSVELWIHRNDATAAEAALAGAEKHHQWNPESHPVPSHGHPVSDHKPDHSRGPQHGAPPHRPLPS